MNAHLVLAGLLTLALGTPAITTADDWKHSGTVTILTTPDGANLPADARVEQFPLLVTLHKDFFDFSQAQPHGEDLRFFATDGTPLPYQIDTWDAQNGQAKIWVRVPLIEGNQRQPLTLKWGNPSAASESSGNAVFNESNGYVSVWHMGEPTQDEVGTLESVDTGTSDAEGMIGRARRFPGGKGIFGGDKITAYPSGSSSHSTEAWFKASVPNTTIIGWGNEGGGRGSKVRMQFRSPPHVHIDSDFSDVNAESTLPLDQWIHVVHTYDKQDGKLYINGLLDGMAGPLLDIKKPMRLWIGGWYDNYDFKGEIDEVRISQVARPASWVQLQYANQKPAQTLVGPVMRTGARFSVSPTTLNLLEGTTGTVTAQADGAEKIYWVLQRNGRETVVAADQLSYTLNAGRVSGDSGYTLSFQAVYPDGRKTLDIPVRVKDTIPDPVFVLKAPATWNGRTPITVVPEVTNAPALAALNADRLKITYQVEQMAVVSEETPTGLELEYAFKGGPLRVRASMSNGGAVVEQTVEIAVTPPATDPWHARAPLPDEKPENGQFYARDPGTNQGTLHYNGKLTEPADMVFLRLYAEDRMVSAMAGKPAADGSYALSVNLDPGLIRYKVEFGTITGGVTTVRDTVNDLVCGDAFLIDGQSNAEATDVGERDPDLGSPWLRSYGRMGGNPGEPGGNNWHQAVVRDREGGRGQIGYWGVKLGLQLVESQKIPICIINGAVGGSRIDVHQRNDADPEDFATIYGRLLWRVRQAKLENGIRAAFWHQGENDQGADGPTGDFGFVTYRDYFVAMTAGWKTDYPNLQQLYLFQIWPKACSMGVNGSDNALREVQRMLPGLYSNLHIMSTLGIKPPGGCHYPIEGYAEFARLIMPLVERDLYGKAFTTSITPANVVRASYTSANRDAVALEFDQPMKWDDALLKDITLYRSEAGGEKVSAVSGSVTGNTIILKLAAPSDATDISYLDSAHWSPDRLLYGANGIAALTFDMVPISGPEQSPERQ